MKIVLASGIYPPDIGGPATYSQLIAREFSKQGIDVNLICYSDKKIFLNDKKEPFLITRILRGYIKPARYFLYFINLLRIAKNADVIYAQGPLATGLPTMFANKILKKKFVIKIVGDYAWEQGVNQFGIKDLIEAFQTKKYSRQVELIRIIQKTVVKSADKVIVPSEFLKRIVKYWGIDDKKIEVVYNAFSELKEIRPVKLDGDVIITAGRLEPWKGFDLLKEIMPGLKKENPKFKLVIVTKMPHKELMGHFKASKMFVLNSGYEGLPHIILEAMACELPVITTNVCGNPELVQDNYNGLLVEYNNKKQIKEAILKLWEDKRLQKKFIENGKKTLEKFTLEKMIKKTLKALES